MTVHNSVLLNAAVAGITAGVLEGEDYGQITSTTIATAAGVALQAQIAAAAAAVDAAIPNDPLISTGGGVLYVVPFAGAGTDTTIIPFFSKPLLLACLCKSAFSKRSLSQVSTYTTIAAGIAAQYAAAVSQQATS